MRRHPCAAAARAALITTLCSATAAVLLPVSARAQQPADTIARSSAPAQQPADTVALQRLIVTATRRPLPAEAVPAAVTVLSGDDLRARGVRMLADALRLTPGTPVAQTGSFGGLTS
ncbi:MAG: hypothetical protein ACREKM_12885, partial [Longimicrobiales bacterium]